MCDARAKDVDSTPPSLIMSLITIARRQASAIEPSQGLAGAALMQASADDGGTRQRFYFSQMSQSPPAVKKLFSAKTHITL